MPDDLLHNYFLPKHSFETVVLQEEEEEEAGGGGPSLFARRE